MPDQARFAVEAADTRQRFSELELGLLTTETTATEQKAERLGAERDFRGGLTSLREDLGRLEAQTSGSTAALGETLTGLVMEAQRIKTKLEGADPGNKDDPWSSGTGPKAIKIINKGFLAA